MSFIGPVISFAGRLFGEATIEKIFSAILGGSGGAAVAALQQEARGLAQLDVGLANAIGQLARNQDQLWVLTTQLAADNKSGWTGSANTQRAIGAMIDGAAIDFSAAIINMIDSYVPNSIINATNYVKRTWIDELYKMVNSLINRIAGDEVDILNLQQWRKSTADPQLATFMRFWAFWQTWPDDTITQLHNWIGNPDSWADWFMHSIVTRMTAYGLDDFRAPSTDDLLRMIWTRTPDVWRYVENAAVAVLLQDQAG